MAQDNNTLSILKLRFFGLNVKFLFFAHFNEKMRFLNVTFYLGFLSDFGTSCCGHVNELEQIMDGSWGINLEFLRQGFQLILRSLAVIDWRSLSRFLIGWECHVARIRNFKKIKLRISWTEFLRNLTLNFWSLFKLKKPQNIYIQSYLMVLVWATVAQLRVSIPKF